MWKSLALCEDPVHPMGRPRRSGRSLVDMVATAEHRSELAIEGMTCGGCASRVQGRLDELDAVSGANVNFATGRATVEHDGSATEADLRSAVEAAGYQVVATASLADAGGASDREIELRRRLTVAAAGTIPVMAVSMLSALHFPGWRWVVAALATVVVWWAGWIFHRTAWNGVRRRTTTMDTLVSLGSTAAWTWSAVVLVFGIGEGDLYFETGAAIITLILLGKWFEARATRRSGDAIRALAELGAQVVRLPDGREIPVEALEVGMQFVVAPGEQVATDGTVVDGACSIDASLVTGEPVPVEVGPGAEVIGATINVDGSITVEATRVGADTALAQIIRLVEEAQGSRAEVQRLADAVSRVFVPVALGLSLLTLAGWLLTGHGAVDAFTAAVAVLIISCPCALGLATPLAIMVGTGRGAQLGVLIKGGEVLEDTRAVDVVVLDKTGTVTTGSMHLDRIEGPEGDRDELLGLAASLEARSEHPIARAIAAGSDVRGEVAEFRSHAGTGVTGVVDGQPAAVGRRSLFAEVADDLDGAATRAEAEGATVVFVGRGGTAEAILVVTDEIKATSERAVAELAALGLTTTLLTGDNRRTAEEVGAAVGVDEVIAEVLPSEKAAEIERLQGLGHRVAMVGDGINDAPALALADLGIAIGTGTDVAMQASDLTIVSGDLLGVVDAIALARRTLSTIKLNLFWAFAYNAAAIPLAAFGVLRPMIAAAAMGASSVFVVTNSLRLRRFSGHRSAVG